MKPMIAVVILAVAACAAEAQQTSQNQVYIRQMPAQAGTRVAADPDVGFQVVLNTSGFLAEGKTVKGAPYSADSTNETVQTLADGNRITHSSSSKVYRDSEGRTRRESGPGQRMESTISMVMAGTLAARAGDHGEVVINDPVGGVSYSLDPEARAARKMPLPQLVTIDGPIGNNVAIDAGKVATEKAVVAARARGEAAPGWVMITRQDGNPQQSATESLGTRNIEGVEAEGKRVTTTIPAGQIGNDLPIVITQETWFSPKLQAVVLSIRHDPRFGDTTYKLTNISLSEPAASLFQVPSDYTVTDVKSLMEQKVRRFKTERDRFE